MYLGQIYSAKKRSSPLDFIFDTCASASWSHFLGWWSWTYVLVSFCRDKCFSAKNMCFAIGARVDTKLLNLSHHVLSMDDWPGDVTFFQWGQPLKIICKYSATKNQDLNLWKWCYNDYHAEFASVRHQDINFQKHVWCNKRALSKGEMKAQSFKKGAPESRNAGSTVKSKNKPELFHSSNWIQNSDWFITCKAEGTFALQKGTATYVQLHQQKSDWRGRGAGVKNKIQGAGPF